jgi:MFS family permease
MFFRMFGVFIILPVAALAAAALPDGSSGWMMGLVVGGYGITQALMQIPTGVMADRWGRKPVLIGALLVFAAGGFVAAAADNVWELIAGRLLQGSGAVAAVAAAWIADITAPERRARAMLVYGAAIALAFTVSLPVAPPLAGWLGSSGLFALAGILGVTSAVAVSLLPPPTAQATNSDKNSAVTAAVWPYAAGAFVAHYVFSSLFLRLPAALNDFFPLAEHWRVYAPALLAAIVIGVPIVIKERRFALPLAAVLLLPGAIMTIDSWLAATIGLTIFFTGFIIMEAQLPARASRTAPAQRRGEAMGVVMTAEFLGLFAGAAISGLITDVAGETTAQWVAALLIFCWFAIISRKKQ